MKKHTMILFLLSDWGDGPTEGSSSSSSTSCSLARSSSSWSWTPCWGRKPPGQSETSSGEISQHFRHPSLLYTVQYYKSNETSWCLALRGACFRGKFWSRIFMDVTLQWELSSKVLTRVKLLMGFLYDKCLLQISFHFPFIKYSFTRFF